MPIQETLEKAPSVKYTQTCDMDMPQDDQATYISYKGMIRQE